MRPPDLYSFEELWQHYRDCRRNKRNTMNALRFEADAEAELLDLQGELRAHTYRPGRSVCFVTAGPKPREVFAADFRDRIIHHLLVAHQERVFDPMFIHDSYACRKEKGTLAASDRLMALLRRVTLNGQRAAWALKLDVDAFFPSIHKETLFRVIARRIRNPEVLWLTRTLLFHDPTANYRFQSRDRQTGGPDSDRYPIPARKSLFGKQNARGLPIGNLTSQFWANVYLNELDHFVKRTLKCRYYVRYVDDMILLSHDREALVRWRAEIAEFLRRELRLELRADLTEPSRVGRGIDFVGWKTWWDRRLPRRRTLGNFRARLDRFARTAVRRTRDGLAHHIDLRSPHGGRGAARHTRASPDGAGDTERLRSVLVSYSGHLRHGAAVQEWARIWVEYPWLAVLFAREGWAVGERWPWRQSACARRFKTQYWHLVRRAGTNCLVFCQVGRFIEFYGPQRVMAERSLGLQPIYAPRAGYAFTAGFPVRLSHIYRLRALRQGLAVVDILQAESVLIRGCKPRLVLGVFVPTSLAGRTAVADTTL